VGSELPPVKFVFIRRVMMKKLLAIAALAVGFMSMSGVEAGTVRFVNNTTFDLYITNVDSGQKKKVPAGSSTETLSYVYMPGRMMASLMAISTQENNNSAKYAPFPYALDGSHVLTFSIIEAKTAPYYLATAYFNATWDTVYTVKPEVPAVPAVPAVTDKNPWKVPLQSIT
jgi:hypothetical protein